MLAGCASAGRGGGPQPLSDPWEIGATEFPSQRLFRVRYDGPSGELSFKLSFYLLEPEVYRMQAADGLGRAAWSLDVDPGGRAVFLDHREERFCRATASSRLAGLPIADLPLSALPKLLLGKMPTAPAQRPLTAPDRLVYEDELGNFWSAGLDQGRVLFWSMKQDEEPVVWLTYEDDEAIFSDRRGSQQLRWRQVVRESLSTPPPPLAIPEGYAEGLCTE